MPKVLAVISYLAILSSTSFTFIKSLLSNTPNLSFAIGFAGPGVISESLSSELVVGVYLYRSPPYVAVTAEKK